MLKLIFTSGPSEGTEFVLESEFAYIGREVDNSVVLDDAKLSRYHFCVAQAPEGYELIDNQSTNGTYHNGQRIDRVFLQLGDEIQAGNSLIKVEISGAVAASAGEPQVHKTGHFSIQGSDGNFETEGDYITAGRSADNHIHLDDQKVSREHAHFYFQGGKYFLKDNSSVNGTYLNDNRIVEEPINDGDEGRIGSYHLKFSFPTSHVLQISVIDPNIEEEYGVEAANDVEEAQEKGDEIQVSEYNVPKPSAEEVLDYIPKDLAERSSKQRYATLIVDAIPKAVLEAGKKEEKRKVPAWVATSDVLTDGRRLWYVGGSVAAALTITLAMFLTGFHLPFMNRPLSKFHQSTAFDDLIQEKGLESGCNACHSTGSGINTDNCMQCHDINWTPFGDKHHALKDDGSGSEEFKEYAEKTGIGNECIACHSEHRGVEVNLAAPEEVEVKCWTCHQHNATQEDPFSGVVERGYHDKSKPLYEQVFSQDNPEKELEVPGLSAESMSGETPEKWRDMIHSKHGEVPGYCNACHATNAVGKEGVVNTNTEPADPKQSCLNCHSVASDASCLTCHEQHQDGARPEIGAAAIEPSFWSKIPGGLAGGAFALILFIPAWIVAFNKRRKGAIIPINQEVQKQKEMVRKITELKKAGKFEKVTVIIKKELCIGCSGCINSCPYDVLELNHETHKSTVVEPDKCLGDMRCTKACPTGACLVIKGDKIPEMDQVTINENHESNVPGLYVIGEGCGKPLIKNAINHGKIASDHVASQPDAKGNDKEVHDVIVVGSGPAGLSAGLSAKENELNYLVLEKAPDTTDTIRNFPKAKIVLAEPVSIPLAGKLWMEDTNKETLVAKWEEIIQKTGLVVTLNHHVDDVTKGDGHFVVKTPKTSFKGKKVILAPGTRGAPNKIGCPGEDLTHPQTNGPRVEYRLTDTDPYRKKHCLVLGGGDSAVEAAMTLADVNAIVTLAYRKDTFGRIKERNLERLMEYVKKKKIKLYLLGVCKEVKPGVAVIKHQKGVWKTKGDAFVAKGKEGDDEIKNDVVFALLGAQAPSKFFKRCGIEVKKVPMA